MVAENRANLVVRAEFNKAISGAKNVVFIGNSKVGKTTLLQSVKDAVYIDLRKLSITPENFAVELVGNVACGVKKGSLKDFLNISYLYENRDSFEGRAFIETINNELQKIKPDQKLLIENAFKFANSFKKITLCLDNFEEFLGLDNYEQIKDVMSLFFSLKLNNIRFVLSGTFDLEPIFKNNFLIKNIENFDKKETKELINSLLGKSDEKTIDEVYRYSNGNPYHINAIIKNYLKNKKNIRSSFLDEISSEDGLIYNSCKFEFFNALGKARGKTLLKSVLKVLASEKELKLSEIAKKIYRSSPVTQSLLSRLISVNLIVKKDSGYSYADLILRIWAKLYFGAEEVDI